MQKKKKKEKSGSVCKWFITQKKQAKQILLVMNFSVSYKEIINSLGWRIMVTNP